MRRGLPGRTAHHKLILLLMSFLCPIPLAAQEPGVQIELNPADPTTSDNITFRLSGVWRDGCIPQSPMLSITSGLVHIQTSNAAAICVQAHTPWALSGSVGKLAAGDYLLVVEYSGPSIPAAIEMGRKSLTVTSSSALHEVVLPIVVNGAFAEKLHYQTIFTILNASAQQVQTTLQVYSNQGKPGGVFCAPIAPPPSGAAATLAPNAEYVQFTSADLPFHDGWALLRWEGSASLLATEEITLVATAPAPCLLVCNWPSTEKLSSTQIPGIRPAKEFRLPVTINRYRQTALALVNPSALEAATVRISLVDSSGKNAKLGVPDSFEIRIRPLERISKFLWQLALESSALTVVIPPPDSFQGSVLIEANLPVAVGALHIMFPQGKFVSIPSLSAFP